VRPGAACQASERALELERLVHRLADEALDDLLAPRAERAATEPSTEAFHASESNALQLAGIAIEHRDSGVGENLAYFILLPCFEIVVSEYCNARHAQRRTNVAREHARFLGQTVVCEIAAQHQQVGAF